MRFTWLVLGVVVAAGAVAFINTDDDEPELPVAKTPAKGTALNRAAGKDGPAVANLDLSEAQVKAEQRARGLLEGIAKARAEGNAKREAALVDSLRRGAWDTPSARRFAYGEGVKLLQQAGTKRNKSSMQLKDKARRLMSRVLYLPEMFTKGGASTDERTKIIETLQKLNRQVMRYEPGLKGVTVKYPVPEGIAPVEIVSRNKLMMGSNGVMFWNVGTLDPRRLRAGATHLLPLEELTLHVHLRHFRMGLFIGDWFVKEFKVGIGKPDTPTPTGEFVIYNRLQNPPWTKPSTGKVIPYGDPRNELGSVWIGIKNEEWGRGAGFGIHGSKDPRTVGTRCSNGCVRLRNDHVQELRDWVRTASFGGKATRVFIK